ncbi:MAG TPA: asparagine synthase (glutamine-hydrolyzing) [Bryobacteraceae bacterium]|nr:asparagine synthase (glutamine-hydrolyzing) [Bryobacteraceae bacterium]
MCGICGIVNLDSEPVERLLVQRMTTSLAHRGPDDCGYFVEGQAGLGHRRLSIIDLSAGHQPIYNEDRSAVIVFNGEIYNYRDLAHDLTSAGHTFRTRSDTETILHAYEEYGDECVHKLRGMFGFAIWDRGRRRLLLARDRLGIKPIYYYQNGRFLAFASEIKALLEIASVPREVDPEALDLYLAMRYVPGPRTMFKNIFRLQPGNILIADQGGVRTRQYWDIQYSDAQTQSPEQQLEQFRELLDESVRLRLIAEVPLGVFLSGGLDSSAILATMSKLGGGTRVKTFSVGYEATTAEEQANNEFEYARLAANAFRSDHHEYRLDAAGLADFVPELVRYLDEPLADPSCVPLYFISKLARQHITVVLSGEGADELLAGYGIYGRMLAIERMRRSAGPLARLAPLVSHLAPSEKLRHYVRLCGQPLEDRYRGVTRGFTPAGMRRLVGPDRLQRSNEQLSEIYGAYFHGVQKASALDRMLYVDAKVWLPDDLLIKADKMTMANGLELRVPFLDHKMVEFAATLPNSAKLQGSTGKSLLRRAMNGVLPDEILHRPKKGFPIPIASWLRTSLRAFTRDYLLAPDSAASQYVNREETARLVQEHERGGADRSQEIWTLLVFEFWHRHFIQDRPRPADARQSNLAGAWQPSCGESA